MRTTAVFTILSDSERRAILEILSDSGDPLTLRDLAVGIARRTQSQSSEDVPPSVLREISIRAHHEHLPCLEEAGVISYNVERRMIESISEESLEALTERSTELA